MVPTRRKKKKNKKVASIVKLVVILVLIFGSLTVSITGLHVNFGKLESGGIYLPKALDKEYGIRQGLDLTGGSSIVYEADIASPSNEDMTSAIAMLQKRLDAKGYSEATIAKQGNKQIRIEIPAVSNPEDAVKEIGATGKLYFVDKDGNSLMEGTRANVKAAEATYGQTRENGPYEYYIRLDFTSEGQRQFAEATEKCVGSQMGIFLDDQQLSAPNVSEKINNSSAIISGNFSKESAKDLADTIRSGGLPFALKDVELRSIGATLGEEALSTSIFAGGIGVLFVLLFMLIVYRGSGLVADIALLAYASITLLLFTYMRINLTLSGIAGIALSIGMAVDANVIVFEQVKEQIALGKSIKIAFSDAYKLASSAIIDGNLTVLISGAVLYYMGTGAIQGFAVTLLWGIVVSVISGIYLSRYIIKLLLEAGLDNPKFYVRMKTKNEEVEANA